MAGPRICAEGRFPTLDGAVAETMQLFMHSFLDAGTDAKIVRQRTLVFAAALQGVTAQILHRRFRLAPKRASSEVAEICRMLIEGLQ
jgi:hypothetical protein